MGGVTAAYMIGRGGTSTTKTVVDVLSVADPLQAPTYVAAQEDATAQSNVRSAIPAAEAFYQDVNGGNNTYTRLDNAALASEAPSVSPHVGVVVLGGGAAYCLFDDEAVGHGAYYVGGDSTKITQSNPPAVLSTVMKVNMAGSATGAAAVCNALS